MSDNVIPLRPDRDAVPSLSDLDLEQAVLGVMLCMPDQAPAIAARLDAGCFTSALHQTIYEAMASRIRAEKAWTPLLIANSLASFPQFLEVGGIRYLAAMVAGAVHGVGPDLAEALADMAARRRLKALAEDVARDASHVSAADLRAVIETELAGLATIVPQKSVSAQVDEVIESLRTPNHNGSIATTVDALDDTIGGLSNGDLCIIAGRPGMGKTALALEIALGNAMAYRGVLFLTAEMSGGQLIDRALSRLSVTEPQAVAYTHLRAQRDGKRTLSPGEWDALKSASAALKRLPIDIVDAAGMTVSRCLAAAEASRRTFERGGYALRLVVVDYLQLLLSDQNHGGNRVQEITEITRMLKLMAKRLGVPVIALSQLSRGVEGRDSKRPMLSDLRDSGSIEQDADQVVFPYREEYYARQRLDAAPSEEDRVAMKIKMRFDEEIKHQIELRVEKNRHGPTGSKRAHCYLAWNRIYGVLT